MIRIELALQLRNRRFAITTIGLVLLTVIVHVHIFVVDLSGMMEARGFNALEAIVEIVFRFGLVIVVLVEASYWFGRHFSEGTLQLFFFSGATRANHWRARVFVFVARTLMQSLLLYALAVALFFAIWPAEPYPLGHGEIVVSEQIGRFSVAVLHSAITAMLWTACVFFSTVVFRGRRFEAGTTAWLVFILFNVAVRDAALGLPSLFGGVFSVLFTSELIAAESCSRFFIAFALVLALAFALFSAGTLMYRRISVSPQVGAT
ncbi:MAG: hypothetical protein ACOC0Y_02405 [Spirochaetota bacterium]